MASWVHIFVSTRIRRHALASTHTHIGTWCIPWYFYCVLQMANAPSTFNVLRSFLCQQNRSPNLNNNNITQKARGKTVRKLHFRFPWALFFKVCAIVQRFSHILVSGKLIGARILLTIGINCVYESLCCFAALLLLLLHFRTWVLLLLSKNRTTARTVR